MLDPFIGQRLKVASGCKACPVSQKITNRNIFTKYTYQIATNTGFHKVKRLWKCVSILYKSEMFYCFFSVYSSCMHFSSERYFNDIQTISSIPGVEWRENNLICDSLFFSCRAWILLGKGTACVTLLRHRISQTREWNTNHSKRSRCVEVALFIGDNEFWLLGPSFKVKQLDCRQKIHFFYFRKPIAF